MCRKEFSTPYNLRVHVRQATFAVSLVSVVACRTFHGISAVFFWYRNAAVTPFFVPGITRSSSVSSKKNIKIRFNNASKTARRFLVIV
jgi:hypothetical protein